MTTKTTQGIAIAAIAIIAIFAFSALYFYQGHEEQTIKIGAIFPLTGPIATWGEPSLKAAQIAVEEINGDGGINGKKLELIVQDDAGTPATAVNIASQMLNSQKINKFIHFSGATLTAAAPLMENKAIVLNPSIRTENLIGKRPNIFNLGQSAEKEMQVLAKYIKEKEKAEKVAIVVQADSFGETYKNAFSKVFEGTVFAFSHPQTETDYRTTIEKIKSENVKVIVVTMNPKPTHLFLKQLKELGVEDAQIFMNWLGESKILTEGNENLAEGIIFTYSFKPSEEATKKALYEKFKGGKIIVHPLTLNSYDAVFILAQALKNCNENDLACMESKIKSSRFDGASGEFSFSELGIAEREIFLKRIQNGSFVYIEGN